MSVLRKQRKTHKKRSDSKKKIEDQLPQLIEAGKQLVENFKSPSFSLPITDFKKFLTACYTNHLFSVYPDFFQGESRPILNEDLDKILATMQETTSQFPIFTQALRQAELVIQAYQKKVQTLSQPSHPKPSSSTPSSVHSAELPSDTDIKSIRHTQLLQELKDSIKKTSDECAVDLLIISINYHLFDLQPLLNLPIQEKITTALQTANHRLSEAKITGDLRDDILRNLALSLYRLEKDTSLIKETTSATKHPDDVKEKIGNLREKINEFIHLYHQPLEKPATEAVTDAEIKYRIAKLPTLWKQFLEGCCRARFLKKIPAGFSAEEISACLQHIKINIFADPLYHTGKNAVRFETFITAIEQMAELYLTLPTYSADIATMRQLKNLLLQLNTYNEQLSAMIKDLREQDEQPPSLVKDLRKVVEQVDKKEKNPPTATNPTSLLKLCLQSCSALGLIVFDPEITSFTKEQIAEFEMQLTNVEKTKSSKDLSIILPLCEKIKELFKNYLFFLELEKLPAPLRKIEITTYLSECVQTLHGLYILRAKELNPKNTNPQIQEVFSGFSKFYSETLLPLAIAGGIIQLDETTHDITVTLPKLLEKFKAHGNTYAMITDKLEPIMAMIEEMEPKFKNKSSFGGISIALQRSMTDPAPPSPTPKDTLSPPLSPPGSFSSASSYSSFSSPIHPSINSRREESKRQKVEVDDTTVKRDNPWSKLGITKT